jgi:hypothetical protein
MSDVGYSGMFRMMLHSTMFHLGKLKQAVPKLPLYTITAFKSFLPPVRELIRLYLPDLTPPTFLTLTLTIFASQAP